MKISHLILFMLVGVSLTQMPGICAMERQEEFEESGEQSRLGFTLDHELRYFLIQLNDSTANPEERDAKALSIFTKAFVQTNNKVLESIIINYLLKKSNVSEQWTLLIKLAYQFGVERDQAIADIMKPVMEHFGIQINQQSESNSPIVNLREKDEEIYELFLDSFIKYNIQNLRIVVNDYLLTNNNLSEKWAKLIKVVYEFGLENDPAIAEIVYPVIELLSIHREEKEDWLQTLAAKIPGSNDDKVHTIMSLIINLMLYAFIEHAHSAQ